MMLFTGELREVRSSVIRAVAYQGGVLTIEFRNGRIYDYQAVPLAVYSGLMQAGSKGTYYNRHIRGKYH